MWKKAKLPSRNSQIVPPATSTFHLDDDREEDGFTFVGESEIERNTVYPSYVPRLTSPPLPPPPLYEEYKANSLPYTVFNHGGSEGPNMASSLPSLGNQPITPDVPSSHGAAQSHYSATVNHPYIADVPFMLSSSLNCTTTDVPAVHILNIDPLKYVYNFTEERHILALDRKTEAKANEEYSLQVDGVSNRSSCAGLEDDEEAEATLVREFGQEAITAQNLQDLFGGANCISKGNGEHFEKHLDLLSF